MKAIQFRYIQGDGWDQPLELGASSLIFVFGKREILEEGSVLSSILSTSPHKHIVGCSTSGEIAGTEVLDNSVVVSSLQLDSVWVNTASVELVNNVDSYKLGEQAAMAIEHKELKHMVVFCDGLNLNGSEFVKGIQEKLPEGVTVTGGLAGDGSNFAETCVITHGEVQKQAISIIGFYGNSLRVSYGSLGGWDSFGPDRLVTRAETNVLYELNGESALELYKKYLGEHAKELPGSGLLFPLSVQLPDEKKRVVRTILGIDEEHGSITFAGDIPQGAQAQLMRANFDRLIDGASDAALQAVQSFQDLTPQFALLVSCVGRKMVLKQRIEEEVEGVKDVLGSTPILTGFYSYGEISPFSDDTKCELHNQTMTITAMAEV